MDNLWVSHLSSSLVRGGVAAYLWDSGRDSFLWAGDVGAVLGLDEKGAPASNVEFNRMINPQELPQRLAAWHAALAGRPFKLIYKVRRGDGRQVDVVEEGALQTDSASGRNVLCGTMRLNESRAAVHVTTSASSDVSTVHNGRRLIRNRIEEWAEQPGDVKKELGYLLAVGIDRLSLMNEAYGAMYVDELIEGTGARLRDLVGDAACVGRLNGDVFGIFFDSGPHNEMAAVAKYVLNNFYESPLQTKQGYVGIGVSIGGIAVTMRECRDVDTLLTKSEIAMQAAKERGRGCFVCYSEAANQIAGNRAMMESGDDFLKALKSDRIRLAFQPVMNLKNKEVSFHECLIRMIGEDGKIHPASEFVPAIEYLGLSRLVDQYAMRKAIHELNQFPDLVLSVNVSYMTLVSREWLRGMVSVLRDRPGIARRLIVEITESMVMKDAEGIAGTVKTLKDLGCRIALDDFGAGFTAFSQLKNMDLDIVKIDKSFIQNIKDRRNHLFVKTLQALADGVNVETVGEGVETMEDARLLAAEGIRHIQGYAFGFPCIERIWLPKGHMFRHMDDSAAGGAGSASAHRPLEELLLGRVN